MSDVDTARWTDREVFERICNAAEQVCRFASDNGHRWSAIYETQALIHGIRTQILASDADQVCVERADLGIALDLISLEFLDNPNCDYDLESGDFDAVDRLQRAWAGAQP